MKIIARDGEEDYSYGTALHTVVKKIYKKYVLVFGIRDLSDIFEHTLFSPRSTA